ncbi:MAG: CapA family protein [Betaproteobacteria bacterium]|nr:CapA family protein [Betaproteobacteria bacterium]
MGQITFALVGDVMINRTDAPSIFSHVAPILKSADFTYCNLEAPMCDGVEKHAGKSRVSMHLRSAPNAVEALTAAGINVVSLANNHALDYGAAGLQQSIELLDNANIAHAGAGRNRAEARRAVMLNKNGVRIALLSYTSVCVPAFVATEKEPGVAMVRIITTYSPNLRLLQQPASPLYTKSSGEPEDVAALLDDVRSAKAEADIVLVAWHWGLSERWGKLADYQRTLGHAVIDAGANAIIGNHAHMLLGIEFYRGCPIFYALGNFGFDMRHPYFRQESAIVQFELSHRGIDQIRLIPILNNDGHEPVPLRADGGSGQKVTWMLEYLSEGLNTKFANCGAYVELSAESSEDSLKLGANNAEGLSRLGYSDAQITELKAGGVIP